jgi:hypothetical protein
LEFIAMPSPVVQALMPPSVNPAQPPGWWNQGVRDFAHGAFVQPFSDAAKALSGRMTGNEAQDFMFGAALGLLPMGRGLKLPIKPYGGSLNELAAATSPYMRAAGNKTMPIDKLTGGVAMHDPAEVKRVQELVSKMQSPEGYFSRIAVDDAGAVLEGQHRLEAARMMGGKKVPVSVLQDLSRGYNVKAAEDVLTGLHPDQRKQLVMNALEMAHEAGGPSRALQTYDLPRGFEQYYRAALNALMGKE